MASENVNSLMSDRTFSFEYILYINCILVVAPALLVFV